MGTNVFRLSAENNEKLATVMDRVIASTKIKQYWDSQNVVAKTRMGYNDHGHIHIKIVTQHAIEMLRLLREHRSPSIVTDHGMTYEDAEVVVFLAGVLHDIGHIVHRNNHAQYSLFIAPPLIDELLDGLYDVRETVVLKGEILHAIETHRSSGEPLTVEAGLLRVADALDMESGRAGPEHRQSIHAISALSVEDVTIEAGDDRPIQIDITMTNSSGIFQLDELAREKIEGSGLEDCIRLRAEIAGTEEKKIIDSYEL